MTYTQTGTCVINASQAGNDTYADAPQVQRSIKVTLTSPSNGPGGGEAG